MIDGSFALAFTAGMVATVNPCGFAMLPAYLSYFLGLGPATDSGEPPVAGVGRALVVSAAVSLGFLAVFAGLGVLIRAGSQRVVDIAKYLSVGIGGTRQAVMTAAALRCLGGELQAQLWPTTRGEIEQAREQGIDDIGHVFTTEELAPGETIVAATGVSNGDLLRGVRYHADSARTHSIVMCTRCNWVRFVDGIHFFRRDRREEVRLYGL